MAGPSLLEVARHTMMLADVSSDLGIEVVGQFVFRRYLEVARLKLRQLRKVGTLYAPAPATAGLVSFASGSNVVTGNTAGPNQTFFSRQNVGWWFRAATNWHQVVDVDPAGQKLFLQAPYAEQTASPNSYALVSRYIKLDPDVRWIGEIVHPRLFRRLLPRTLDWLDRRHPARIVVGAIPTFWAEGPHFKGEAPVPFNASFAQNSQGGLDERKQIEVYPSSTQVEMFQYSYWAVPNRMDLTDTLPPEVDIDAMSEGILIDVYRRAQLELARKGKQVDLSGLIADQKETWARAKADLQRNDKGQEDEEVDLWTNYESGMESDISSEYDRYSSSLGLITVQ